jgi:excisionase family DNA binding protein
VSPRILTIAELAEYLRVSEARLYELLKGEAAGFPAFRVGRGWRVNLDEMRDWMCQQLDKDEIKPAKQKPRVGRRNLINFRGSP